MDSPAPRLHVDIETYSSVDVKLGVYAYSASDDFDILMAAWSLDGAPTRLATTREEILAIPGLDDPTTVKVAHNAQFERVCFSRYLGMEEDQFLPPEQWDDTMARAAEHGYPQTLGALAKALGAEDKDEAGTRLIKKFSVPNRKGARNSPSDFPEDWQAFCDYCVQDVDTLVDIDHRLGGWPVGEFELFCADQRINDRGIRMDTQLAHAAVDAGELNAMEQELELMALTGVRNPNSLPQLLEWFSSVGHPMPNLRAETVEKTLSQLRSDPGSDWKVARVLELRQDLALVASKKYLTALGAVSGDHRLRGAFRFFGAHTGRWAGRGVQLHNLPRAALDSEAETDAAIDQLYQGGGASSYTLKALVRALFVGPFVVSDYSAIEARVIAWLSGEEWVLDAFRAGRDIYVETAGRMFGLDPDEALARRKDGKVAVLALGYNGGVNSLRAMGAEGSDARLKSLVARWRSANPQICSLWSELDAAFPRGGEVGAGLIKVVADGRDRHVVLPSGRSIVYHGVAMKTEATAYGMRRRMTFQDPRKNWARVDTYGGRLSENITQAVARDLLGAALIELSQRGFSVVGHVHDEVLVEAGEDDLPEVEDAMCAAPAWAAGLPLAAEAFCARRYRKG